MNKLYKFIVLFIFLTFRVDSFDSLKYNESSFDKIILIIENALTENKKNGYDIGIDSFGYYLKINFNLKNIPNDLIDENIKKDMYYSLGFDDKKYKEYSDLFSINYKINYKNYNFNLLFQKQLIPNMKSYIDKKVLNLNENIELYIMFGSYNGFSKNIILFVNNYSSKKK